MRWVVSEMQYDNVNVVNSLRRIRLVETRKKSRTNRDDCMIVHRKENI